MAEIKSEQNHNTQAKLLFLTVISLERAALNWSDPQIQPGWLESSFESDLL